MALPRPVVNAIRLQPPAARPVSDTGSYPGVFMKTKPGRVIALGVIEDVHQRRGAALGDRAQRLLENILTARLPYCPGDGLSSKLRRNRLRYLLYFWMHAEQLFGHLRDCARAAPADAPRRKSRWSPPAPACPPISASRSEQYAQRRIRRDAGERIRPAAIQSQHDLRRRHSVRASPPPPVRSTSRSPVAPLRRCRAFRR